MNGNASRVIVSKHIQFSTTYKHFPTLKTLRQNHTFMSDKFYCFDMFYCFCDILIHAVKWFSLEKFESFEYNTRVLIKKFFLVDKFYLTAFAILIPTSINLSITQFVTPLLNAIMGRTDNPAISISSYSIAISVLFLIALPNLRIQHLTIVYYKNINKLKVHFFVILISTICLFCSVLIIYIQSIILFFYTILNIHSVQFFFT